MSLALRSQSITGLLLVTLAGLTGLCLLALVQGPVEVPLQTLWQLWWPDAEPTQAQSSALQYVITHIRLPRLVCALSVGAALAASGCALQALFRNPLADPALIGISNGAALGAVSVIVLGGAATAVVPAYVLLPLAAFIAGMITTFCVVAIASSGGQINAPLLLLAGVAINAIAGAGIGVLTFLANDNQLRDLTFWSMGSLAKADWPQLAVAVPVITLSSAMILRKANALNGFLLGESVALHIGHDVKKIKRQLVFFSALAVGTAVSIAGVIFFVGLVVPHWVRICLGPDNTRVLPLSMVAGAGLLLAADIAARSIVAPAELPIGLLMSLIGGPFFVALLLGRRSQFAG